MHGHIGNQWKKWQLDPDLPPKNNLFSVVDVLPFDSEGLYARNFKSKRRATTTYILNVHPLLARRDEIDESMWDH